MTIDEVRSLLKGHPEVLDDRRLRPAVRIRLELDSLPRPLRDKRLLCTAARKIRRASSSIERFRLAARMRNERSSVPCRSWIVSVAVRKLLHMQAMHSVKALLS